MNPGLRLCAGLGLAHALADAASGWLLFSQVSLPQGFGLFLLYNLIGFAFQPLAGTVLDDLDAPRSGVIAGLGLLAAGLWLSTWQLPLAILAAALGSALFHSGAGAMSVLTGRHAGSALFTAPGVLGLSLGTAAALIHAPALLPGLLFCLLLLAAVLLKLHQPDPAAAALDETHRLPVGSRLETALFLLLAAIALRSFIWSGCQILSQGQPAMILLLGISAALGKLLGGLLGARFGWRHTVGVSLALAIPLLAAGPGQPLLLALGVAALQASTPLLLTVLIGLMPRQPATAAGLALGLALAVGGAPLLLLPDLSAWLPVILLPAGLLLGSLWLAMHKNPVNSLPGHADA
ncbi:MAG: hypothetical protein ACAI44_29020 [Candidatus Sericytochromatia bacterium]